MIDLTDTMKSVDCKIISIGIDLYKYIKKDYTHEIYNVAFDFMLERYIYETENHKKGIILLESRGRIDDVNLLKHIDKIINKTGEKKISRKDLRNKIKGVYFNPKWSDDYRSTFIGLEIADLFSYPIYKYIKRQHKDKAFLTFEEKIVGYPKYENKGIKRFPSQNKN